MIRTLKWFFERSRAGWWRQVLLGSTIAISPALLLAADKDRDRGRDQSNKQRQNSSARPMDGGKPSSGQPMRQGMDRNMSRAIEQGGGRRNVGPTSAPLQIGQPKPNQSGIEKNQLNFRSIDDSAGKAAKGSESKRTNSSESIGSGTGRVLNGQSGPNKSGDEKYQQNGRSIDNSASKTAKGSELKRTNSSESIGSGAGRVLNGQSGPNKPGNEKHQQNVQSINDSASKAAKSSEKRADHDPESTGRNKFNDPGKTKSGRLSDRGSKSVNPEDLKQLKGHHGTLKNADFSKKPHKDDDFKFGQLDSKKGNPKKIAGNFLEQHKNGKFDGIVKGAVAKKLDLNKQFGLKHKGDLTLKLNLEQKIKLHGGWSKAHWAGLVGPGFGVGCSPIVYCGPGYFPSHCLYPGWSPWVEYCWWFRCDPIYDPRPSFCRPWIYDPCPVWVYYDYPVWYDLPVVACGTWIDVEKPVVVVEDAIDLQLLAVRFVDPGQPELREGPRYRVWARNNSDATTVKDFNILLMASNSSEAAADLPQAGVRVDAIEPGETRAFDIRLPFEASMMNHDAQGHAIPFEQLHAVVDSHREVLEAVEENNGAVIARGDILPVDPVIFGTDSVTPTPGTEINIAGEGFGPEPGQILVNVNGIELQAEIEGWYDLGVRVKLPSLALASPADAELMLIRGDTAASNPLTVQLTMPVAVR